MKVLILTQYFYPDIASTGQLLTELSVELSKLGIIVEVITGYPSYSYKIPSSQKEDYYSVKIRRIWSTRLNKNKLIGQITNSITFFTNALLYLIRNKTKTPLLIVSNPPFLPFLGYLINKIQGKKFIFLVHDVFPEKAVKLDYIKRGGILHKIWKLVDYKILSSAEFVIVLSETMKAVILNKLKFMNINNTERVLKINNWADGNFIYPSTQKGENFKSENRIGDKFIVLYSGNLGASYELEKIIEAAVKTKDEKILYVFIGDGVKKNKLENLSREHKLTNVKFFPYLDKSVLPFSLNSADISILTYEENLEGLLMPSKLYTILASGKPIIALCRPDSEVSKIIEAANCGFTVYKDTDEFVRRVMMIKDNTELRKKMGDNSRIYFEKFFSINNSVMVYRDLIEKLNS
ncbi:MAG: hypothetical protein HGGPFJEG_02240 [Ignavibacteria bacterium]|nr:hypothetical protein [Ignavibacteria bacterium]